MKYYVCSAIMAALKKAARGTGPSAKQAQAMLDHVEPIPQLKMEGKLTSHSDEPALPMELPIPTDRPLRERAAVVRCRYCGKHLHDEDDRMREAHDDCEGAA